jgi:hypothetical protein
MTYNTIKIKKFLDIVEEYEAAAAITPGMLLELTSAGKVQAHSGAGQNALPMFALENELEGEGIGDAYAADDKVQTWIPVRGEMVYAILADGNNVSIGDYLESNGAGYLQKHETDSADVVEYPNAIVAQALEAVDTSGSSGEESSKELGYARRILVRIV